MPRGSLYIIISTGEKKYIKIRDDKASNGKMGNKKCKSVKKNYLLAMMSQILYQKKLLKL